MTDPSESQMQAFMATDQASPVIFVNCHRYFFRAKHADNFSDGRYPTDVAGRDAYHRYPEEVVSSFVPRVSGRVRLAVAQTLVLSPQGLLINSLA